MGATNKNNRHETPLRECILAVQNWAAVMSLLMTGYFNRHSRAGRLSLLILIAEPLALLFAFYFLRGVLRGFDYWGDSILLFLASGIFPFYMFVSTAARVRRAQRRTYQALPRIKSMDQFMAATAANAMLMITVMIAVFLGMWLYGIRRAIPVAVEQCALAIFFLFLLGTGFGLINSVIARIVPIWPILMGLTLRGMIFFSAVARVGDFYRPALRDWLVWNPIFHGIEWNRLGLYGSYPTMTLDKFYLVKCAVFILFVGIVADRATLRWAHR